MGRLGRLAYIGLGSNLNDRGKNLKKALQLLRESSGIKLVRTSSVYESKAWGKEDQPPFLNLVAELTTVLAPELLLKRCLEIEKAMGRVRGEKWGPRIIDLDILLYGSEVIEGPDLVVPHPYLLQRGFVVLPLLELNWDIRMPQGELIRNLVGTDELARMKHCTTKVSVIK